MMFNHHPALVKALQQDRYYRLLNERRRGDTIDFNDAIDFNDTSAPRAPKAR